MAIGSLICLLYLGAIAHGGRYRNSIKHEDKTLTLNSSSPLGKGL